jgi:LysM repeat protein
MIIRAITILLLVAAVFGGAAYFSYELYWKPDRLDREDSASAALAVPTPTPDYTLEVYSKIEEQLKSGQEDAARTALAEFLVSYPNSVKAAEAEARLGQINSDNIFSAQEGPHKTAYTVARGDALAKIAGKFKTSAELIYRVNNLETINLQVGQVLYVPQIPVEVTIHREKNKLVLSSGGEFLKSYDIVSLKGPGTSGSKPVSGTVSDKFNTLQGKRVAFGDKNFVGSERTILLSTAGLVIRAMPADSETAPGGIVLSAPDLEEVFLLVARGTPVTIQ